MHGLRVDLSCYITNYFIVQITTEIISAGSQSSIPVQSIFAWITGRSQSAVCILPTIPVECCWVICIFPIDSNLQSVSSSSIIVILVRKQIKFIVNYIGHIIDHHHGVSLLHDHHRYSKYLFLSELYENHTPFHAKRPALYTKHSSTVYICASGLT